VKGGVNDWLAEAFGKKKIRYSSIIKTLIFYHIKKLHFKSLRIVSQFNQMRVTRLMDLEDYVP